MARASSTLTTLVVVACCFAALVGQAAAQTKLPFSSCASSGSPVTVDTVSYTGDLKPGATINFSANGTTTQAYTGGHFSLKVKFIGITLYTKTGDLCSSSVFHFDCPVSAGPATGYGHVSCVGPVLWCDWFWCAYCSYPSPFNCPWVCHHSFQLTIPSEAPPGPYTLDMTGTGTNGDQLFCIIVNLKIS